MRYTIKQIADMAGVTPRTIRYYDEVDLLKPASIGENSYRYYDDQNLLTLQQILFYRELDVPLKEIRRIMAHPDFSIRTALADHRKTLHSRMKRLEQLVETIDHTLSALQGEEKMTENDYFKGFDEKQYDEEARQRWGKTPQYAESQRKWKGYSAEEQEAIIAAGEQITHRMVGSEPGTAPDDPAVQAAVGEYCAYLNKYFYTCDLPFLRNLADMWEQDPRFAINYERIREGGAAFVRAAVHHYCDIHTGS